MSFECNACLGTTTVNYSPSLEDWKDTAETPCPVCQSTTTLEINVGLLDHLAHSYFYEVLDTAEANKFSQLFATALSFSTSKITIPATEEMVEQFDDFVQGAQP